MEHSALILYIYLLSSTFIHLSFSCYHFIADIDINRMIVSYPVIGAAVGASVLLVLASIVIFVIIVCMRTRTKSLDSSFQLSPTGSNSPDSHKKKNHSRQAANESKNVTDSTDISLNYSSHVFITVEEVPEPIQLQTFGSNNYSRRLNNLQAELEAELGSKR